MTVLDNPVWSALAGPQADVAHAVGGAARYPRDVAPFGGLSSADAFGDLARVVGSEGVVLVGVDEVPDDWETRPGLRGVQLVGEDLEAAVDPETVPLGKADVPEMLDLVRRTEPGPFLQRTVSLGNYLGIRRDGALIAMAGERMRPTGWTEISAVCTDPAYRGHGLATRLIRAVAVGIRERGDVPFLHAAETNTGAIRLYESIGFELRRHMMFQFARPRTVG
ncbi:MAG TPA: GNAT family N-acetyltransferase [Pseudonocardiaceae bacterium]|jgi:ribosomal protein S18 acetylase RimI-like enzyme|nr:GNAT family N-acetyltransferase [Pseudonocardiaceae bacterium]